MPELIGLPSVYFSDAEMQGSRVRLLTPWDLGDGHQLDRGECFVVTGVKPGDRQTRQFWLRNHRALNVPVKAQICELVLSWPVNVEGKRDGRK